MDAVRDYLKSVLWDVDDVAQKYLRWIEEDRIDKRQLYALHRRWLYGDDTALRKMISECGKGIYDFNQFRRVLLKVNETIK